MSSRTLLAGLILSAISVFAQSGAGTGSISGTVVDASGGAVPNATVTVENESKGVRRALTTTSDGIFSAAALVPADGYKVTINKSGFAAYQATDISVAVGQNVG